jgi:hypothetical protein
MSTAAKESASVWRLQERGSDRSALATSRYADKRAVSTQLLVCLLAVKTALAVTFTADWRHGQRHGPDAARASARLKGGMLRFGVRS